MAEGRQRQIQIYSDSRGREPFSDWRSSLGDIKAQAAVLTRIVRASLGNFGDHESVGDGVYELRIHLSPGYRVYFALQGRVVILLCGGTKGSQKADILRAKKYWEEFGKQ